MDWRKRTARLRVEEVEEVEEAEEAEEVEEAEEGGHGLGGHQDTPYGLQTTPYIILL